MGYYGKMPENVEGLQIAGKKFYKAAEGDSLSPSFKVRAKANDAPQ